MSSLDPSDPAQTTAAARDSGDSEAADALREPAPAAAPLMVAPTEPVVWSVRPMTRVAPRVAAALIVVIAFGAGIGVGRVTAPAGPAASAATAASPGPSQAASSGGAPSSTAPPGTSAAPGPSGTSPLAGLPSNGALLGSATAKVQMTYWADFQCPFCSRFAHDVLPPLAPLIADGTVSVRHRDFVFLGPESVDAAIAVRCGGEQGKFWPMHDAVYAAQQGENTGSFAVPRLQQVAATVGLDASSFAGCLVRHDVLVAVLTDTSSAVRAGVSSTPTVDLPAQRLVGAMDAARVLAAIQSAAASGATPTPAPSVSLSGDPWAGTPTSGLTAGTDAARVTVELWTDYQAAGTPDVVKTLERALRTRAASGKVRVVLRDLATMGDESALAASFVRCAAQDGEQGVWLTHSILGGASRGAGTGLFTSRALLWLGAKLGYDVNALDACMAAPATAAAITADTAAGTALGLRTAPAVVVRVGGKVLARFDGPTIDAAKVLAAVDKAR
ncbi:MAG TPA: thioredoxin domain-containing protein [Candidatus Limnocylindrales bacterium]